MGNHMSAMDPVHVRMYSNMIQIRDPQKRIQIIQTCLASMEYVTSAKRAGVYSYLLHYVSTVQHGGTPPSLPGEHGTSVTTSVATSATTSVATSVAYTAPVTRQHVPYPQAQSRSTQLTHHVDQTPHWKVITDTSKQKAMTYFSSCLEVLGIQEEVALTDETLKSAYKRMALKSHPDKGAEGVAQKPPSVRIHRRPLFTPSEIPRRRNGITGNPSVSMRKIWT
jgi:hypothetical protein